MLPQPQPLVQFIDVDRSGTLSTNDTNVTKYAWDGRNRLVEVTDYAVEGANDSGDTNRY